MTYQSKILVVDDTAEIRLLVKKYLKDIAVEVHQASNGLEAIKMIESGAGYELVLLDVMMDVMDGHQAMEKIQEMDSYYKPKVCFLSAKRERRDVAQGVQLGAYDYLPKPLDKELLISKVSEILGSSHDQDFVMAEVGFACNLNSENGEEAIITEISESHLKMLAPFGLEVNSLLAVYSKDFKSLITVNYVFVRILQSRKQGDKYGVTACFVGLNEVEKQKIRVFTMRRRSVP